MFQLNWLDLFVIYTAFTVYFVSKNIMDYFEYETISRLEIIYEKPTQYPYITICNSNPFTTTKLADQLITNLNFLNKGLSFNPLSLWSMIDNYSSTYDELIKQYVELNTRTQIESY